MRILTDISIGAAGYSGIPQDCKWLLKTMAGMKDTHVDGFFYDLRPNLKTLLFDTYYGLSSHIMTMSSYIGLMMVEADYVKLDKKNELLDTLLAYTGEYKLIGVQKMLHDSIWRIFLMHGLIGKDKKYLEDKGVGYVTSAMNMHPMYWKLRNGVEQSLLNTEGYDFIVLEDSRPMRISEGTRKIVRYHDPLPLTCSDTFMSPLEGAENHYLSIRECLRQGAYYVCNTDNTRKQLIEIFPEAETNSTVIPYALSDVYFEDRPSNIGIARNIINVRQSSDAGTYMLDESEFNDDTPYLLSVATIEPRKNYHALIDAYAMLLAKYPKLRLVICGASGWKNGSILAKMKSLMPSGNLFYLPNIHPSELYHLYKNASAFVSLSFDEGFGLPPMEAQALGITVVSSNIAPHTEVQGDGSIFADPYDVDDIVDAIDLVLKDGRWVNEEGIHNAQKLKQENIIPQWEKLLEELKSKG